MVRSACILLGVGFSLSTGVPTSHLDNAVKKSRNVANAEHDPRKRFLQESSGSAVDSCINQMKLSDTSGDGHLSMDEYTHFVEAQSNGRTSSNNNKLDFKLLTVFASQVCIVCTIDGSHEKCCEPGTEKPYLDLSSTEEPSAEMKQVCQGVRQHLTEILSPTPLPTTSSPSSSPSRRPAVLTPQTTLVPSVAPSPKRTEAPAQVTSIVTEEPSTANPSSSAPTRAPTRLPTQFPSKRPSPSPTTQSPNDAQPSIPLMQNATISPTASPSEGFSHVPSVSPTKKISSDVQEEATVEEGSVQARSGDTAIKPAADGGSGGLGVAVATAVAVGAALVFLVGVREVRAALRGDENKTLMIPNVVSWMSSTSVVSGSDHHHRDLSQDDDSGGSPGFLCVGMMLPWWHDTTNHREARGEEDIHRAVTQRGPPDAHDWWLNATTSRRASGSGVSNNRLVVFDHDDWSERNVIQAEHQKIDIVAPAGSLGIVLDTSDAGGTYVLSVKGSSSIGHLIAVGDWIVRVDELDVSNVAATRVVELLSERSNQSTRKLTVLRECEPDMQSDLQPQGPLPTPRPPEMQSDLQPLGPLPTPRPPLPDDYLIDTLDVSNMMETDAEWAGEGEWR